MTDFNYTSDRFADLQMLRYRLEGFEHLPLRDKLYIYCLAEATLWGRDIVTDQKCIYNIDVREALEQIYLHAKQAPELYDAAGLEQLTVYLKRIWFSNGIHHHYSTEKILPEFSESFLRKAIVTADVETDADLLVKVILTPDYLSKGVSKGADDDVLLTSASNYYVGVTQQEAEDFYASMKCPELGDKQPSWGLNSRLVKTASGLQEEVNRIGGRYSELISQIVLWLKRARSFAANSQQTKVIDLLVSYYETGDLTTFDEYSIEWLKETDGTVDFINGFIEVYGDPLGLKASWEGLVEYKDLEATKRTRLISDNAQWFEDHSPIDDRFRKPVVKGVIANAICAAMLGGDEYPSTAIGINLPNAEWIRAEHGSKSVTITNITDAYNKASKGNGFRDEFVIDDAEVRALIENYGDRCDDLHTDLHECLGHGSGQLLPGVSPDALKNYGSTIEEARADLFGLYYIADPKMVELGLLPDAKAFRSHYYTYMLNGLLTQATRIELGHDIEEAHMRNRALIASWAFEHGGAEFVNIDGKTYLRISDYDKLRSLFAQLLREIQRIKSEGDYDAARLLVEQYGVKLNPTLHKEILDRYKALNLAPYKGFINPRLSLSYNADGSIADVKAEYGEDYDAQMLRYSRDYSVKALATREQLTTASLKEIKQSFRLYMNGTTAASQRNKGMDYHLNWGVQIPHLKELASQYAPDHDLAMALWRENIRECKILATMLMPKAEMTIDEAEAWAAELPTQEIAEISAMYLFAHLPFAVLSAISWISSESPLLCICGYNTLSRVLMRAPDLISLSQRDSISPLANKALTGNDIAVAKAAMNCMNRYSHTEESPSQPPQRGGVD